MYYLVNNTLPDNTDVTSEYTETFFNVLSVSFLALVFYSPKPFSPISHTSLRDMTKTLKRYTDFNKVLLFNFFFKEFYFFTTIGCQTFSSQS